MQVETNNLGYILLYPRYVVRKVIELQEAIEKIEVSASKILTHYWLSIFNAIFLLEQVYSTYDSSLEQKRDMLIQASWEILQRFSSEIGDYNL